MNSIHTRIFVSLCIISAICLSSCDSPKARGNGLEGKIVYDLTYPYERGSVMMDLYPTEMTFHFKGSKLHSEIKSSYDIMTTNLIVDCENKVFTQLLKNMSKRYSTRLNEEETRAWYMRYPQLTYTLTDETMCIAGYICNKAIAHFANDSLPAIDIYYTKGLGLSCSNWWNPFDQIDGFLMGYDMEQYGMRMHLRAKSVSFEAVDDECFAIPKNFEMIDGAGMDEQMRNIISDFVK